MSKDQGRILQPHSGAGKPFGPDRPSSGRKPGSKNKNHMGYLAPPPELTDKARARLRELAGHHVPLTEIAAVLRLEFKIKITSDMLELDFADEILLGRAYAAVKISEKTIECALEGSATAQKALFDRTKEAGQREEALGGGRQLRQIKLVVVENLPERMRENPLKGNRDTTKLRAGAEAKKEAAQAALEEASRAASRAAHAESGDTEMVTAHPEGQDTL